MNVFLVTYDLNRPGQNYDRLWEALDKIGSRALESAWVVEHSSSAEDLRNHLGQYIDDNDGIFVVQISNWASRKIKEGAKLILKKYWPNAFS